MPNAVDPMPSVHPEPLFTLNLGANGGILSPRNVDELSAWIQKELSFWSWFVSTSTGSHRELIANAYRHLAAASTYATEASQHLILNPVSKQRLSEAHAQLTTLYLNLKLPHSTSALGKRVEVMRTADPVAAVAYLCTQLPNAQNCQFEARDFSSWKGFFEGFAERSSMTTVRKSVLLAATASVEELKIKVEVLIAEKRAELEALHRSCDGLAQSLALKDASQTDSFDKFIISNQQSHDEIVAAHIKSMTDIENTFREKMVLRGPVEYWSKRQKHHQTYSGVLGLVSFVLIVLGGGALAWWAGDILKNVPVDKAPAASQIAALVIAAVFLTWAIRLVIRMFLSHSHLRTDAAERVVMTQTYLALLEDQKLNEEKDRSLILGALFRPASDGMVKDENIPHPLLEALTRIGGKGA